MKKANLLLSVWGKLRKKKLYQEADILREFVEENGGKLETDKNGNNSLYENEIYEESLKRDKEAFMLKLIKLKHFTKELLVATGHKESDASHIIDKLLGDVK